MITQELDFITVNEESWIVYAKNSMFNLGQIAWSEDKHAYDYQPNANGNMMKLTQREVARKELQEFCREKTAEREERGGNKL